MSKPIIVFRVNAGKKIGLGHLVRCTALASILKKDFDTTLILRSDLELPAITKEFKKTEYINSFSVEQELELLLNIQDCILVLDGYAFDFAYQYKLKSKAHQLVCVDDIHSYSFLASVIINHGGGVQPSHYSTVPWTQFYLGPQYALLREPFLHQTKNHKTENKNLFICFGGADPDNYTLQILTEALNSKNFSTFKVVVGNGYQHLESLIAFSRQINSIKIHKDVSAESMASLMADCSFAVCSPSSVAYEYLSVGSTLFLVKTADNQSDLCSYLISSRLAFDWKDEARIDDTQIAETLKLKISVFNGKQAAQLRNIFLSFAAQQKIKVRNVTQEDLRLCYAWANDPEVRQNSFTQEPIPFETHVTWFNSRLSDQHSYFYILENEHEPIGQIRFQVDGHTAILNYLVDARFRGKGLGGTVVSLGIKKFVEDFNSPITIHASVKFSNLASQRVFEKMKFEKKVSSDQRDSFTYIMTYNGIASWK